MLAHNQEAKLIMIVRKLRLQRGWSQGQLAYITDLNVRTIQRIERGQVPSLESKKSLAAAFEVQLATFDHTGSGRTEVGVDVALSEQNEANISNNEKAVKIEDIKAEEEYAINFAKSIKEFYNHLLMYLIFAVTISVVKGFDDSFVIWGLIGWTAGVTIHGLNTHERIYFLNANWETKDY
ncbi:MAG: transcriptional regulator with XRE-family HTH domain [Arenicella sp.]|jgi:transcriptional regulator with XRE-family HTH domain